MNKSIISNVVLSVGVLCAAAVGFYLYQSHENEEISYYVFYGIVGGTFLAFKMLSDYIKKK